MAAKSKALDFTNVKERSFNPKHLPEGDYPGKVLKVDDAKSKQGNAMWVYTLGVTEGAGRGATYPYHCVLNADNIWKVRNLFAACGINIPKKKINIDPNKVVGRPVGLTLEDDEYEGKMKSVVSATIPISEVESPSDELEVEGDTELGDEEPEDKPAKKAKKDKAGKGKKNTAEPEAAAGGKKKKAKPAVDDEELEELEVDEL
jgi:hypothetical protein